MLLVQKGDRSINDYQEEGDFADDDEGNMGSACVGIGLVDKRTLLCREVGFRMPLLRSGCFWCWCRWSDSVSEH